MPGTSDVKTPASRSTATVDSIACPDAGRNGVEKYENDGTRSCSVYTPSSPPSKSYTDIPTIAEDGSTNVSSIASHPYAACFASRTAPEQQLGSWHSASTPSPKQQQPDV